MALVAQKSMGFFSYKRESKKLPGGARVDWRGGEFVREMEEAAYVVNKRSAKRLRRLARHFIAPHSKTGALYNSIKVYPAKYQVDRDRGRVSMDWVVFAGDDKADYAMHVETGRAFRDSGGDVTGRVKPIPFMRRATSNTRKWVHRVMRNKLKHTVRRFR